jgi:hypothetical protein
MGESSATPQTATSKDLREVQLDYAWKWFSYHAAQRISMFNFFLAGVALLAGALATLFAASLYTEALAVSILGCVVCIIFRGLDSRNRDLISLGERLLLALEKTWIFHQPVPETSNSQDFGILAVDVKLNGEPAQPRKRRLVTHSKLIPFLQWIVVLAFLLALAYALTGRVCVGKMSQAGGASELSKDVYERRIRACIYSSWPWH